MAMNCQKNVWKHIGIVLLAAIAFTCIAFTIFPDAPNVVGVFAGILASIAVIIQLHEHFNKAKQNA